MDTIQCQLYGKSPIESLELTIQTGCRCAAYRCSGCKWHHDRATLHQRRPKVPLMVDQAMANGIKLKGTKKDLFLTHIRRITVHCFTMFFRIGKIGMWCLWLPVKWLWCEGIKRLQSSQIHYFILVRGVFFLHMTEPTKLTEFVALDIASLMAKDPAFSICFVSGSSPDMSDAWVWLPSTEIRINWRRLWCGTFFHRQKAKISPTITHLRLFFLQGLRRSTMSVSILKCSSLRRPRWSLIRKIARLGCIDFQQMPHASSQVTAPWQMIREPKGGFWSHVVRTDLTATVLEHRFVFIEEADDLFSPAESSLCFQFLDQEILKHIISQECSIHFPTPVFPATASHTMAAIACNYATHVTRSFDLRSSTGSFLFKLHSRVGL